MKLALMRAGPGRKTKSSSDEEEKLIRVSSLRNHQLTPDIIYLIY